MQSPSSRRRVVVFDIDSTLCKSNLIGAESIEYAKMNHAECPLIEWRYYNHLFLPHLRILFDYLLKQGVRIVFFSSAGEERNVTVIPKLLTSFYGDERYETLKSEGQFAIFSDEQMRKGTHRHLREGNYVKDLGVVIRDGESILDVILVEDDRSFVAHDQQPYLYIMDLGFYWYLSKNKSFFDEGPTNFSMNSTYYMLGIFMTYFGHEKFYKLPLREGIKQILPADWENYYSSFIKHPFSREMIDIGLLEVQKQVPDAVFYGCLQDVDA